MEVIRTSHEMRTASRSRRTRERRIALVPTMGAFHSGHLSLMHAARSLEDVVAVSIYVNPLQFSAGEDFESYPRQPERDLELAAAEGVDIVFMPSGEDMDPPGRLTTVSPGPIGRVLEGASRPGHFSGVCTAVAQLFNAVEPDVAYFGQKDAQQVAVIKRLVADLSYGVVIEVCPTVREPDGLAMSSRNAYLSSEDRARAAVLFQALRAGRRAWVSSEDVGATEAEMERVVGAESAILLDYAHVVDPISFAAPQPGRTPLLVIAARVGPARLIDNLLAEAD